jgi:PAS domain S-box-containing protein
MTLQPSEQPISSGSVSHTLQGVLQSKDILVTMLASAPIAIVVVDRAGIIRYANSKLEEMFGYYTNELINQPIETLIPERFRNDHRHHRNSFARNPHVRPMGSGMDLAGRRKDSSEFPIEAGLSYINMGDELLVMGSITDITRRKQTEDLLERRVEERTRELERRQRVSDGLRDILAVLNSNLSLEEILGHITAQACQMLHADASAIFRNEDSLGGATIEASYGLPNPYNVSALRLQSPSAGGPLVIHANNRFSIISASEPASDLPIAPPEEMESNYRAVLTVPLSIKDEPYGSLMLYYNELRKFSAEEIELATTMGDQTALAIANARLRTQVERTAVTAERNRIARDLHDSVTQTLFSASMIAEVLPRLWHRDRNEASNRLNELRQLTRGALAEMRTLLLELRPAKLIEVELAELLRQLAEAITGRSRVPITLAVDETVALPPDIKVAFYHIAQEALNNVAKHARATHATVKVESLEAGARLVVQDDGRGFMLEKVRPEHLGLTIMHERAEAIGARLEVQSIPLQAELAASPALPQDAPAHGTSVIVQWLRIEEYPLAQRVY